MTIGGRGTWTAGKLPQLEIYDNNTMQLVTKFEIEQIGHQNRIFTAKFSNNNPYYCYTGSWDRSIKFWDLRAQKMVTEMLVPSICGESVDLKFDDKTMVVGCGELGQGIQIWDLRKIAKVQTIDWTLNAKDERNPLITYCQFNKAGADTIMACATHETPAKVLDYSISDPKNHEIKGIKSTVMCADQCSDGSMAAFGDIEGYLTVKEILF